MIRFPRKAKIPLREAWVVTRGNSDFLSIVNDIIFAMLLCVNFEVKFVMRQMSSIAHILARAANSWTSFHRLRLFFYVLNFW
jgi:hypothetical protein